MSYYRIKYNIDTFKSPHYRFYHAQNAETAINMFEETKEQELIGYNTSVIDVVAVVEANDCIAVCRDEECCNNDCQ